MTGVLERIEALLRERRTARGAQPLVLGIAGAQGSGKSTLARALAARHGCPVLSLDDLYLGCSDRQRLAERVHPLLATRGVPGTHDVALGLQTIESLGRPGTTLLPRFDKRTDAPTDPEAFAGPARMLVFEGWCLGAEAQDAAMLAVPVNALERDADPDGRWRGGVNARLADDYARLFARIDLLVFLAAPAFDVVAEWRIEQERKAGGPMTDAAVRAFVLHYQRITQDMLARMPAKADLTIRLDRERRPLG